MAHEKRFTYTITGRGAVPMDMLRYDRASPFSSADANKIEEAFTMSGGAKSVVVVGPAPTEARWESFGWRVSNKAPAR